MSALICPRCYYTDFRLSRLRWKDAAHLAAFHYPVRCCHCDHRHYSTLPYAVHLRQERRSASSSHHKTA